MQNETKEMKLQQIATLRDLQFPSPLSWKRPTVIFWEFIRIPRKYFFLMGNQFQIKKVKRPGPAIPLPHPLLHPQIEVEKPPNIKVCSNQQKLAQISRRKGKKGTSFPCGLTQEGILRLFQWTLPIPHLKVQHLLPFTHPCSSLECYNDSIRTLRQQLNSKADERKVTCSL